MSLGFRVSISISTRLAVDSTISIGRCVTFSSNSRKNKASTADPFHSLNLRVTGAALKIGPPRPHSVFDAHTTVTSRYCSSASIEDHSLSPFRKFLGHTNHFFVRMIMGYSASLAHQPNCSRVKSFLRRYFPNSHFLKSNLSRGGEKVRQAKM